MKTIFWKLLKLFDSNYGYITPLQKRFKIGDECKISHNKTIDTKFEIGEIVYIIENARYDYLIQNNNGMREVVYQFELDVI